MKSQGNDTELKTYTHKRAHIVMSVLSPLCHSSLWVHSSKFNTSVYIYCTSATQGVDTASHKTDTEKHTDSKTCPQCTYGTLHSVPRGSGLWGKESCHIVTNSLASSCLSTQSHAYMHAHTCTHCRTWFSREHYVAMVTRSDVIALTRKKGAAGMFIL